jgi:threonyl-tRNA synthetase
VPYLLVVGDREVEARAVAARDRSGNDLGTFALDDFSAKLEREVADRTH